jgi:heterodisulfide reductase subunit A-like polyferredoxin
MAGNKGRYIIDFRDIPSARQRMLELDVEKRKDNFAEVELGLGQDAAQAEARRCLSCRRCLGCELCLAVCKPKAIVFDQEDEIIDLIVDEIIISPEVDRYIPLKEGEFGYLEYINVVSAFEFERILSEDGPYGGLIMRTFDGDIPEKIGFILDKDLSGKKDNNNLLSYIIKEATLSLKKTKNLEVSVFVPETTDIEKISDMAKKSGITIKKGNVVEVKEIEDTKSLVVRFMEDAKIKEEEFQMLVISKPPEIIFEIPGQGH